MDANQVERVAEALCAADNDGSDPPYTEGDWRGLSEVGRNCYRRMARWHLAALSAPAVYGESDAEWLCRQMRTQPIETLRDIGYTFPLVERGAHPALSPGERAAALRSLSHKPATDSKEPPHAL